MRQRVPQSKQDLERHLQEQIGFLERSAEAFDAGYQDEAKRLAVTIRVLVHDTHASRSLLSQLGRKGTNFCDSAFDLDPTSLAAHAGLAGVSVGRQGVMHAARLDGEDPSWFRWVDFDTWWSKIVIRDREGRQLTRRDLVLVVANQDGGAHVDPALDEEYASLSRDNTLGLYGSRHTYLIPLTGVELVSIRQIAHEVLKTLKPGYERKPRSEDAAIIGNVTVHFHSNNKTAVTEEKVARNDPCPCGSGKKFKHCHGAASPKQRR
jgi:hypothetical protein